MLTKVICIVSPKDQVEKRRKLRDGEKYNPNEYQLRDIQDEPNLQILRKTAVIINNLDDQLNQTVSDVINHTLKHNEKVAKRKT